MKSANYNLGKELHLKGAQRSLEDGCTHVLRLCSLYGAYIVEQDYNLG